MWQQRKEIHKNTESADKRATYKHGIYNSSAKTTEETVRITKIQIARFTRQKARKWVLRDLVQYNTNRCWISSSVKYSELQANLHEESHNCTTTTSTNHQHHPPTTSTTTNTTFCEPPAGWRRDSGTNGRRRAPGKTHPNLKNLKNLHTLNFFKSPGGMRRWWRGSRWNLEEKMEDKTGKGYRMEENIAEDIVDDDELLASMPGEEGGGGGDGRRGGEGGGRPTEGWGGDHPGVRGGDKEGVTGGEGHRG